ncbi:TPR domain protein putative component of TonB system [Geitlerinema sp. FC II]|uniref:tetratricopeptide repeat protein n=1 Tax=Baaleninema simplex TaxID=2862350 RepID=UPI0003690A3F|nr:tetratricopeptide repeat protein [Baaleninema simplex]MDC0832617.1 tetratricopeptide repeat protein [Geitlerinema sp. CS-897]PPT05165.1 TPR domain protein putative component of TonB system [Geitlerinema sp. FC II]
MNGFLKTQLVRIATSSIAIWCASLATPSWGVDLSKYFNAIELQEVTPELQSLEFEELAELCANASPVDAIEACSLAVQMRSCHEPLEESDRTPECVVLLDNLGAVLEQVGRYEDALTVLRYALQLQPNDANVWYNLGIVFAKLNRYQQALDAFEEAARLNPNDTQAQKQADLLREILSF